VNSILRRRKSRRDKTVVTAREVPPIIVACAITPKFIDDPKSIRFGGGRLTTFSVHTNVASRQTFARSSCRAKRVTATEHAMSLQKQFRSDRRDAEQLANSPPKHGQQQHNAVFQRRVHAVRRCL
jgi:hypothetical protein